MSSGASTGRCASLVAVIGPTGSGKTDLALDLAERIGGEILCLDSAQVYRGLDIGTAKPTPEERARVPHHLFDVVEPTDGMDAARWVTMAEPVIAGLAARGRVPVLVGGTGLWLKALLHGLFEAPPPDAVIRARLEDELRDLGPEALHARLTRIDPDAAARIAPADRQRIVRALEYFEQTGERISRLQAQFDKGRAADECRVFVLQWPTAQLNARIDRRVDEMFAAGLVDEVRALLRRPEPLSKTAVQAVGYREVIEHLRGERGLPETVELVKTHTRRFAKRQRTWFRSLSECRFVAVEDPIDPAEIARQVAERL